MLSKCFGATPLDGRIDFTFSSVNISPFFISFTTNKERLKIQLYLSSLVKP
jgi:vancomycin resistance protein YoaR